MLSTLKYGFKIQNKFQLRVRIEPTSFTGWSRKSKLTFTGRFSIFNHTTSIPDTVTNGLNTREFPIWFKTYNQKIVVSKCIDCIDIFT